MLNSMNWFDIITLSLILLFGLKGMASGMVREIFGILGLIGGFFLAVRYKVMAGQWISQNIYNLSNGSGSSGTETIAGFLGVLFGVWIVCLILGEISSKLLSISGLGFIDRIGGFIFSALKIFLVFAIVAVMIKESALLNKQTKPFFASSVIYPYLVETGSWIMQSKDEGLEKIKNITTQTPKNETKEENENNITIKTENNATGASL